MLVLWTYYKIQQKHNSHTHSSTPVAGQVEEEVKQATVRQTYALTYDINEAKRYSIPKHIYARSYYVLEQPTKQTNNQQLCIIAII